MSAGAASALLAESAISATALPVEAWAVEVVHADMAMAVMNVDMMDCLIVMVLMIKFGVLVYLQK